jgi:hypothetical protein
MSPAPTSTAPVDAVVVALAVAETVGRLVKVALTLADGVTVRLAVGEAVGVAVGVGVGVGLVVGTVAVAEGVRLEVGLDAVVGVAVRVEDGVVDAGIVAVGLGVGDARRPTVGAGLAVPGAERTSEAPSATRGRRRCLPAVSALGGWIEAPTAGIAARVRNTATSAPRPADRTTSPSVDPPAGRFPRRMHAD